jgi:hypothetical protein
VGYVFMRTQSFQQAEIVCYDITLRFHLKAIRLWQNSPAFRHQIS